MSRKSTGSHYGMNFNLCYLLCHVRLSTWTKRVLMLEIHMCFTIFFFFFVQGHVYPYNYEEPHHEAVVRELVYYCCEIDPSYQ